MCPCTRACECCLFSKHRRDDFCITSVPPLPRVAACVSSTPTWRSACVCAGERAHGRACVHTLGGGSLGFGHPLKPQETQSGHKRRRTPRGLPVNCVTVHKRRNVASTFLRLPETTALIARARMNLDRAPYRITRCHQHLSP